MTFQDRHVVITGGTGALGIATVGALLEQSATCHIPYRSEDEAQRFPHRANKNVSLVALGDLSDEALVDKFYAGLPKLWASIHIAGGFAMGAVADTDKAGMLDMLNTNFVTCYLCSRAAVQNFGPSGGRIVNITARPGIEPRQGSSQVALPRLPQQGLPALVGIRWLAGQHLTEDGAQAEDVAALVQPVDLAAGLLRRHVRQGADHRPGLRLLDLLAQPRDRLTGRLGHDTGRL